MNFFVKWLRPSLGLTLVTAVALPLIASAQTQAPVWIQAIGGGVCLVALSLAQPSGVLGAERPHSGGPLIIAQAPPATPGIDIPLPPPPPPPPGRKGHIPPSAVFQIPCREVAGAGVFGDFSFGQNSGEWRGALVNGGGGSLIATGSTEDPLPNVEDVEDSRGDTTEQWNTELERSQEVEPGDANTPTQGESQENNQAPTDDNQ